VLAPVPNETLDRAEQSPLGDLDAAGSVSAAGAIGTGPDGAADVQWFEFTLSGPSAVSLAATALPAASPFLPVVSLYNTDAPEPLGPYGYLGDPYTPLDHRLLAQGGSEGTAASVAVDLGAGTYFVAVSGAGNTYFNPFVADSGLPGTTGRYQLLLTAAALPPTSDPTVLASTPAPGAVLEDSPFVVRLDLNQALAPSAIDATTGDPAETIRLVSSPTPNFNDPNASEVLVSAAFSPVLDELQLTPEGALAPAYYELLADFDGQPLGATASALTTAEYKLSFHIDGSEGVPAPDAAAGVIPSADTPATAHPLTFSAQGFAQAAGAVGDDPYYGPTSADPYPSDQLDVYQFTITGPGLHAVVAETWAGRIGSPLFAEESLFQEVSGPGGQTTYDLLGTNAGTGNPTQATGGPVETPLAGDPVLFAGLPAGSYYLAVTNAGAVPDLNQPSHTFSSNSLSTGDFVVNLQVQADPAAPQVVAGTPAPQATLDGPPAAVTVRFSQLMNVQQLEGAEQSGSVYLEGAGGFVAPLRFVSYNFATNEATFLPLLGLPNGPAQLHLVGITDVAGRFLTGADSHGNYSVSFTVQGPVRGTNFSQPLVWEDAGSNEQPQAAQYLGPLFPLELQEVATTDPATGQVSYAGGVTISRDFASRPASAGDTTDYYQFQLLQSTRTYGFNLCTSGLPAGVGLTLTDAEGNVYPHPDQLPPSLGPGVYTVGVTGLPASVAGPASYSLVLTVAESADNPPPLNLGPAPAVRLQLVAVPVVPGPPSPGGAAPPSPVASLPVLVVPALPTLTSDAGVVPAGVLLGTPAATAWALPDVYFSLSVGPVGLARVDGGGGLVAPRPPALSLGTVSLSDAAASEPEESPGTEELPELDAQAPPGKDAAPDPGLLADAPPADVDEDGRPAA
jgi:hypothetical protein